MSKTPGSSNNGKPLGGGKEGGVRRGAPFPPRPKAIATFLSSSDFLPGCQALLHSVKARLPSTKSTDQYPPEIIVLLSSKISGDESIKSRLYPIFCTRIITAEHIPIIKADDENDDGDNSGAQPSHVKSWDENCGWTKLRLFELENYDTILYIDADCLVVKDVSHLLDVDSDQASSEKECTKRAGLLAAAPDIFPPDKFNAGVMVIRPSKSIFEDMMSCLSGNNATASKNIEQSKTYKSYDGGDTGFLNSYYPHWFRDMPSYSRLSFGYNAQRFMHHCTFDKQPNYWNEGIEDLRIVHYSSSPKPWEKSSGNPKSEENDKRNHNDSFLDEKDADSIQRLTKRGKLENMWQAAYERSQKYYMKEMQKRLSQTSAAPPPSSASVASHSSKQTKPPQDVHRLVQKRFKELRKTGKSTKEAMQAARAEYGMDQAEEGLDPSRSVGQMFGLM